MNIGTAIKTLRKEKGYSQKALAEKCDLSVNALCQIETNATFPQKSTISKICEELQIPMGYLLFFSLDEQDIPVNKRDLFNSLTGSVRDLLLDSLSVKT